MLIESFEKYLNYGAV